MQAQSQPLQPEQPLLLGRYRVVEQRGAGGFASVLVCWDIKLERKVAIKCMPLDSAAAAGTSTLKEALDEARLTSRLIHPNVVTVHDFEVVNNTAYLIMEYVDGLTLTELMARVEGGVLTYDECAHLLNSLSAALDCAHENGVLHLDIKPSNVFIDMSGTIKLGDFGMASLTSAAGWEGARGGTVGYMPPEQLQGQIVDERADVFALAVVCYQALTGASPFAAADADASLKKILKGAQPLAKAEPELKGPVSDCIGRALNPEPTARQSSAGELARSTLPYLGDELDGQASIAELMAQAAGETGPSDDAWENAQKIPFCVRHPWFLGFCNRACSTLALGGVAARFVPGIAAALGIQTPALTIALIAASTIGLLACFVPQAAGIMSALICVVALLSTGAYSPVFLVAVLTAGLYIAWYLLASYQTNLSQAALFAPVALGSPLGAAALSGFVLSPAAAALTAAAGSIFAYIMSGVSAGDGTATAVAAATTFSHLSTWTTIVGSALAGWLAALFMGRAHTGVRIFGQVLACALLLCFQLIGLRVENGGLWSAPGVYDVLVAVSCLLLMSIAIGLSAPTQMPREDD